MLGGVNVRSCDDPSVKVHYLKFVHIKGTLMAHSSKAPKFVVLS